MPIQKLHIASLFDRNTLLHLRLPFSFFLFPVFCFGISQASNIHAIITFIAFIALHFFIYPGSNVYNSYMDKDEGSIGGLKHPPPVTKKLYYASIVMDVAGLCICALAGFGHALVMSGYVAFSKAYSWHGIRLKKYATAGWLMVAFFQGGYTYMLANMAATDNVDKSWFTSAHIEAMVLATLLIGAYYPLTQIYQHDEDGERGDYTISYKLGIRGTFIFSTLLFIAGIMVSNHYFNAYFSQWHFIIFAGFLLPVMVYFLLWFYKASMNKAYADYDHAMRMTFISSVCTIGAFTTLFILNNQV